MVISSSRPEAVCAARRSAFSSPSDTSGSMAKAEAEFMEREMKSLQKKFAAEKEKLHLQFVAERKAEYGAVAEAGMGV